MSDLNLHMAIPVFQSHLLDPPQRADYLGIIPSGHGAVSGFSTTITLPTSIIWVVFCFQINVIYNMLQISED